MLTFSGRRAVRLSWGALRLFTPHGSLFFHIDPREVHYCKVLLDQIFTRPCFPNEIIWAYDYGAPATKRWPAKHDNNGARRVWNCREGPCRRILSGGIRRMRRLGR